MNKSKTVLTISIHSNLTTNEIRNYNTKALNFISQQTIKDVIIDFTQVDVLDLVTMTSYIELSNTVEAMGIRSYLVNLHPSHALTLVDSEVDFSHIRFMRNTEQVLKEIHENSNR